MPRTVPDPREPLRWPGAESAFRVSNRESSTSLARRADPAFGQGLTTSTHTGGGTAAVQR